MIKKQLTITSFAIVASISLMLLASSALLPNQVVQAGFNVGIPTLFAFEKTLKTEGNCDDPGEIFVKQTSTQSCHFTIEYRGPEALITDVIPADWDVNMVMDDIDNLQCALAEKGKSGKSATGIDCGEQTDITIMVWMTTRENPGGGHKEGTVYKPTTCNPQFVINDGAIATSTELDEGVPVFVKTSNSLTINAEDLNDLDCDGIDNEDEIPGCENNPDPFCTGPEF